MYSDDAGNGDDDNDDADAACPDDDGGDDDDDDDPACGLPVAVFKEHQRCSSKPRCLFSKAASNQASLYIAVKEKQTKNDQQQQQTLWKART